MRLKEIRNKKGITQDQLAAKSGIDQTTISAIERGIIMNPTWDTVKRLSSALRVKPEILCESEE
jgi:transcriptional regulator with XRE-family HTH domain